VVASAKPLLELPGEIALHRVVLRAAGELAWRTSAQESSLRS
jgi:hypothetical protein